MLYEVITGPKNNLGSTNIQQGIRQATTMLASSPATIKMIIILGDGLPSYSYKILHWGTSATDPFTFDYSFILGGGDKNNFYLNWNNNLSYDPTNGNKGYRDGNNPQLTGLNQEYSINGTTITNHKFATVAEAQNTKNKGYKIITIGFGLDSLPNALKTNAADTLKAVADNPSSFYQANKTADSLTDILNQIVGGIVNIV